MCATRAPARFALVIRSRARWRARGGKRKVRKHDVGTYRAYTMGTRMRAYYDEPTRLQVVKMFRAVSTVRFIPLHGDIAAMREPRR